MMQRVYGVGNIHGDIVSYSCGAKCLVVYLYKTGNSRCPHIGYNISLHYVCREHGMVAALFVFHLVLLALLWLGLLR